MPVDGTPVPENQVLPLVPGLPAAPVDPAEPVAPVEPAAPVGPVIFATIFQLPPLLR